ncbi:unnamed protein product [Hydatigera taeniaeformis]|uniref:PRKCSH-like domain-containing protein n=1 Tax=Hydatigena taeniaeformis TaxID=6205 RepID=A0A0R3WS55_HYDTA|nr:unnamed protein product [Hydatigera taeniaeformis]
MTSPLLIVSSPVGSLAPAMGRQTFSIWIFLLAMLRASEVPTGVHPSSENTVFAHVLLDSVFYEPFKPFTCLDKSATIPWDRVNDDYCDCLDGSDEPGTSACPDMEFYCPNVDHEGVFIHSSFVNDMVCGILANLIIAALLHKRYALMQSRALAKEREEQVQKRRKEIESGHQIYQEYVTRKAVELAEEAKRQAEEAEKRALEEAEKQMLNKSADSESDIEMPPLEGGKTEHIEEPSAAQANEDFIEDGDHEVEEDKQDDEWKIAKGVEEGASLPSGKLPFAEYKTQIRGGGPPYVLPVGY